jgi:hypothetical protein
MSGLPTRFHQEPKDLGTPALPDIVQQQNLPADFKIADLVRTQHMAYTTSDNTIWTDDVSIQCLP